MVGRRACTTRRRHHQGNLGGNPRLRAADLRNRSTALKNLRRPLVKESLAQIHTDEPGFRFV